MGSAVSEVSLIFIFHLFRETVIGNIVSEEHKRQITDDDDTLDHMIYW